ncbi:tail fiber domain-containing protein [Flavobacterium sp. WC2509]|uniref:tail fiber domain-containing protein n=1 Tax=Flavobacterium sp. WC2509 TaxID=3461406 RepID=UPI004044D1E7
MKVITKTIEWSVFIFLVFQTAVSAQIKVGDNPTVVNSSAIMEIESANKGFLLPRLQLANPSLATPLSQHVAGMIVYNTATVSGLTPGFYYNDGSKWIGISQSAATGLLSADNGLTSVAGVVKLGGSLTQPTILTTTAINTFAINGLSVGDTSHGDFVIIDKTTGVLKTIPYSVIEGTINNKLDSNPIITAGTNTKITYDAKGLVTKGEVAAVQDIQGLQIELNKKASLDSPVFTGAAKTTPINATSSADAIANKSYVDNAVSGANPSVVSQTITDGQTTTAPSENAVHDALLLKADKTYVDTQDALKADKTYVDSRDALKADKTYVDTQDALKADKIYVDTQVALKADKTYVDTQDALKADKTYVDSRDALKADKTYVDTQVALKADKTYVDTQDALKADKIYVDTQVALKADKTYVDTQDALKADKIYVDTQVALKADKTYVDTQDALKADKTYVDTQVALKADKTYVDTQDALKADKTYVDSQDVLKADKTYVDSQNVLKADKTYVDTQDALKADKTYVDTQVALKADKTYVDTQDALKADKIYVDTQVALKADKTYVDTQDALKADKTYVDKQVALKADKTYVDTQDALKADKTYVDSQDVLKADKTYVDSQNVLKADKTYVDTQDALKADKTYVDAQDALKADITYVDSKITSTGNIYTKDGTLTDNRKITLDSKNLEIVGSTAANPTRLAPDGTMTVGGNVNINNKVTATNAPINSLQFTNDENGAGYAAASITAQTGDNKAKGQLSFKVKTTAGVDTEVARMTDKGNVLIGGTTDNNYAVLNVQSTTKGVLIPRQTELQRNAINSAAPEGLLVYQTDNTSDSQKGQYLKTSTGWSRMLLEGEIKQDYFEAKNTSGVTISGNATVPIAVHITGIDNATNAKNIDISDPTTTAKARFDGVVIDNVLPGGICKVYLRYISVNNNTSAFTQNAFIFLNTGGTFTNDPSSLPFGVDVGKILNISPTEGAILFTVYPVTDFFRNQYERIKNSVDETVFTGRVVSSLEPLDDTYLTNKKYVDEAVAFARLYQGAWNAATNSPPLEAAGIAQRGWARDVTVASGALVNYTNMCAGTNILKGDVIKFDGNCWVVLEKQYPSATTSQEGMVKLDGTISSSTSLVPTSNLLKAVSDANQSHIVNISNPHSVTKAQVGLANVDNTSDANKPVSTLQQTALDLKADKTYVDSQDAFKADKAYVDSQNALKADKTYVDTQDALKADKTYVDTQVALKADKSYVDSQNALKADKTYVDTQDALKADKTYVDTQVALKADKSYVDSQNALKADKTYVDSQDALKADKTYVDSQNALKADKIYVDSQNALKADKTYVDTQNALKADKTYVDTQDALKADKTYVDNQDALKADKTYVDTQVALKADKTYVDTQDALKADKTYVDTQVALKADKSYVDSQDALKADKTYVDTQVALKADKSYVDSQDALKADKTYVDTQVALKADKTYVDTQDALKADKTYVDNQDALKADKTYVDSQDALKADKTYVDTQDALKADKTYVDTQVALKADKTYVDSQDALKADKTYVDTQDALKADKTYVDSQDALKADKTSVLILAGIKADKSYVDSQDALKADKTYVDTQDALKADKSYVDTQNALKADKSYVDSQDALKADVNFVIAQDALKADKTYVDSQNALKADKTYVDSQDALKANKTYVDSQDVLKADITYVDAKIEDQIIDGEINKAPSQNAVFDALSKKSESNPAITAGTNTKITYDAKGLVTKGEVAAITDIQGLQTELNKKAPLDSPLFTGTPKTVPINVLSAENSIVNKSYVDDLVNQAKTSVVSQTITDGQTVTAPSENVVYDALVLKAPVASPTFTGVAKAVTPTATSDVKSITTKEYVDVSVAQVKADVISQSILLNNAATAPSEDAVRKELDLKAPLNSPVFTGTAKVPDITTNSITDPLAIANKGYVDSKITDEGNIYTKDGTLTDNRKVTLDGKNLDFIGDETTNPTRLSPNGTMTVGGNVNLNTKVATTNTAINALQFTNDENGAGYAAASITAQTGGDKSKGQLSFKVKTATGIDTEAARITDKGNVLIGGTTDDDSAILNVQSTTKGVLMPRQTEAQRNAISTPAQGLQVYQTATTGNSQEGQYLNTSAGWKRMLVEGEIKQDYFEAINTGGAISGTTDIPIAVHITDVDASNNKKIAISDANSSAAARFDGVVIENVAAGALCKVYLRYVSHNINTSAYKQNASVFLSTAGGFTHDPSSLPFGVRIGKAFSVGSPGSVLFSAYLVADVLRNQFEQTNVNTGLEETVFTGPIASDIAPLGDNYLANKKYVDETVASLQQYQGVWNAATNTPTLVGAPTAQKGWTYDVTVASGGPVNHLHMCATADILKGDVIKFDGTCWVVLEKQFQSATTSQEGVVKLDAVISASNTLVPTSNLLKSVSDANQAHIANTSNPHSVTKSQVGLANVDDTSDANKPVSGPQQTALNLKADKTNGVSQITDSNPYANIGTLAGVTQADINASVNTKLGEKTQLNGTGLVRMTGTAISYDNTAYAPLASPVFTGDANAVTPTFGDNDTSIATTAFVNRYAVDLWSKTGNNISDDSNFIGTINNKDLVFKAHNIERMRLNQSLGQVEIGNAVSPTKLSINTTSEGSKNDAFKIITNDPDPFIMAFQAFGAGTGPHYFDISAFSANNIPGNISMLSEGGILSVGKDDFTGLSEKLEVNGNVRATGFKIPNGTSGQFLMADGSISTGSFTNEWSLNGNAGTDQSINFIGTTDDSDIVFRANNRERWRMGSDTGRLYVGALNDVNSAGSVYIIPEGGTTNSTPLTIKTADIDNALNLEFKTHLAGGSKYFEIKTFVGDNTVSTPASLSLLSEGGVLNLGYFDFTGLNEKLEVNGKVRATGFKTLGGTASQYLMADGSTSTGPVSNDWSLTGNSGTIPGTNFIGTTDNKDVVFKANNIERMRVNNANGKLSVGTNTNPGSLLITTSSSASTAPFSIATSDANPLVMTIQDIGLAPNNFFSVDAFRTGSPIVPANVSYLSSGGLFSIGYNDYTGLTEKVEVNGNVRATGFKIPSGTSSQFLMADGSTSTSFNQWSLLGNSIDENINFIGTTNDADIVFKGNNKERWRMGTDTGTLYVGDIADPTSSGTLMVVTNATGADSTPFIIKTADTASPLVMSIQTITRLGQRLFKLSTQGETLASPSNFSFMPDGGNLNIGSDVFTASSEKVEVNGNVRATGFKVPGGTASQFLMADGTVSTNSVTNAWSFSGNAVTETSFIGTTNSSDIIFKGNNKERWRMGTETGTFYVGDIIDPDSSGTLMVVTNTSTRNNTPFIIRTSDATNPLTMAIITDKGSGTPFFRLTTKGEEASSASNLALLPDGGVLNIGGTSFSGQQEKVEVTGFVRAEGFKTLKGKASEYLMADGSVSSGGGGGGSGLVVDGGVDATLKPIKDASNNVNTGLLVSTKSITSYGSANANNTAFGQNALAQAATGRFNTALGYNALYNITTGENNTAIGYSAGAGSNNGSNSVYVGANTTSSAGATNEIVIGAGIIGNGTNTTTIGDSNTTTTFLRGTVFSNGSFTNTSDERLKTNITKVENGLADVMKLRPVAYDKKRMLTSNNYDLHEIGFIAQDLKKIFQKGVVFEGTDKDKILSVNYDALIPVLTNAIQEQQKIIDEEKAKNDKQQKEIDELKAIVKQLLEKKS